MFKKLVTIRGAICCENTKKNISDQVCKMFNQIIEQNKLSSKDIVSIQFSVTNDLNAMNPATALRKGETRIDISQISLFCSQEPQIVDGLEKVIRVIIFAYKNRFFKKQNVYLDGTENLRK